MPNLYKSVSLAFLVFTVAFISACNPFSDSQEDIDETIPEIEGAQSKTVMIGDEVDWLYGVEAHDENDGDITENLGYDDSGVDLTRPGTYSLTYLVEDSSGNSQEKSVTIEVVEFTEEYFINLDKSVYQNLKGEELAGEDLDLVENVAPLRVSNNAHVLRENFSTDESKFNQIFPYELSESEINYLKDYSNFWDQVFDDIDHDEIEDHILSSSFISVYTGRSFDDNELDSLEAIIPIEDEYYENKEPEDPSFDEAYLEKVEEVIDRELNEEEIYTFETFKEIVYDLMVFEAQNEFSEMLSRNLTFDERQAFRKLYPIMNDVEAENEFFPTIDEVEAQTGKEFDQNQTDAYYIVEELVIDMYAENMIHMFEDVWGRDLEQYEKDHVYEIRKFMFEYEKEHEHGQDPHFIDATVNQVEEMTDMYMNEDEIASRNYIVDMNLVIYFESQVGRELTEEERQTVSDFRVLKEEYEDKRTDENSEFEDVEEEEYLEVIDRELTEEEEQVFEDIEALEQSSEIT